MRKRSATPLAVNPCQYHNLHSCYLARPSHQSHATIVASPTCSIPNPLPRSRHFATLSGPFHIFFSAPYSDSTHIRPVTSVPANHHLAQLENHIKNFRNRPRDAPWPTDAHAAWHAYTKLPLSLRTPARVHAFITALAASPHKLDRLRLVELFDSLHPSKLQPDVFAPVIQALLNLDRIGKAVSVAQVALDARINPSIAGIDPLLLHLIHTRQWQLCFRVFDTCVDSFQDESFFRKWSDDLFTHAASFFSYCSNIYNLINAIRAFPNSFSPEASRRFIYAAVEYALRKKNNGFQPDQVQSVYSVFADLELCDYSIFDQAIAACLRNFTGNRRDRLKSAFKVYQTGFIYHGKLDSTSSQELAARVGPVLTSLLRVALAENHTDIVRSLFKDWRDQWRTSDLETTKLFVSGFARLGDVENATIALSDYVTAPDNSIDYSKYSLDLLYPILKTYAHTGDPPAIRALFDTMSNQIGLKPDLKAHNILIDAYQASQDLNGALGALSDLLEAGFEPDESTFGSLMVIAARRGDSTLLAHLRRSAFRHNVAISPFMNTSWVASLLNNGKHARALRLAAWAARHYDPKETTPMFNLILGFYGSKDIKQAFKLIRRLTEFMEKYNVPYDSSTYSRLMRAYTRAGSTYMADSLLRNVMLKKSLPTTPIHFAIVMEGYALERKIDQGFNIHAEMLRQGLKPDINSKYALMTLNVRASSIGIGKNRVNEPTTRADLPEELLHELIELSKSTVEATQGPILGSTRFSRPQPSPAAYMHGVIALYNKYGAHDVVESLVDLYEKTATRDNRDPGLHVQLHLFSTLMMHSQQMARYEEVDRYWYRLKEHVISISETAGKIHSRALDQSRRRPSKRLIGVHRAALAISINTYLDCLALQGLSYKIQATIQSLLAENFNLDSSTWNRYIRALLNTGWHSDAFSISEKHLIPAAEEEILRETAVEESLSTHGRRGPNMARNVPRLDFESMGLLMQRLRALKLGVLSKHADQARILLISKLQAASPKLTRSLEQFQYLLNVHKHRVFKRRRVVSRTRKLNISFKKVYSRVRTRPADNVPASKEPAPPEGRRS